MLFVYLHNLLENGFNHKRLLELFMSFTMIQTITIKYCNILNAAGWFISCIFICYLITPFLIHHIRRINRKYIIFVCYSLIAFFTIFADYVLLIESDGIIFNYLYKSPYFRVLYYIIGLCLGVEIVDYKINFKHKNSMELFTIFLLFISYKMGIEYSFFKQSANILYIPVFALALIVFYNDEGIISKFLSASCIQFGGDISLFCYLLHYPIINYGGANIILHFSSGSTTRALIGTCIMFIVILILSYICLQMNKRINSIITNHCLSFLKIQL